MSGFIEGENRYQSTLFPESLDEYVVEDSPAKVEFEQRQPSYSWLKLVFCRKIDFSPSLGCAENTRWSLDDSNDTS